MIRIEYYYYKQTNLFSLFFFNLYLPTYQYSFFQPRNIIKLSNIIVILLLLNSFRSFCPNFFISKNSNQKFTTTLRDSLSLSLSHSFTHSFHGTIPPIEYGILDERDTVECYANFQFWS